MPTKRRLTQVKTFLATEEILTTLDDVVEALDAGTDDPSDHEQIAEDDALFAERARPSSTRTGRKCGRAASTGRPTTGPRSLLSWSSSRSSC
jgi:hypothetical protein